MAIIMGKGCIEAIIIWPYGVEGLTPYLYQKALYKYFLKYDKSIPDFRPYQNTDIVLIYDAQYTQSRIHTHV